MVPHVERSINLRSKHSLLDLAIRRFFFFRCYDKDANQIAKQFQVDDLKGDDV